MTDFLWAAALVGLREAGATLLPVDRQGSFAVATPEGSDYPADTACTRSLAHLDNSRKVTNRNTLRLATPCSLKVSEPDTNTRNRRITRSAFSRIAP